MQTAVGTSLGCRSFSQRGAVLEFPALWPAIFLRAARVSRSDKSIACRGVLPRRRQKPNQQAGTPAVPALIRCSEFPSSREKRCPEPLPFEMRVDMMAQNVSLKGNLVPITRLPKLYRIST
jgi:hypothetical protein